MARSTFFYNLKAMRAGEEKDKEAKDTIRKLYCENAKGNESYGYRRICDLMRQIPGYSGINHKRVARLMREMGLAGYVSKAGARKYSSYKGTVGKVAENVVNRNFKPERPNMIWSTDITEFRLPSCGNAKVYLSPIKDFCDGSIISHRCSTSPNMDLVMGMLEDALGKHRGLSGLTFHSDQGWQYQNRRWIERLGSRCIEQSMSRKGNCMDNGKMESFFSTLKKAIWFGREKEYKSPAELIAAIDDYIYWYNNKRIQHGLNGMTPLQYRRSVAILKIA